MARAIAAIRRLCLHHPGETITLRFFSIGIEKRRVDSQTITGQPGQPLNVKRRPSLGILPNPGNVICPENENVAAVWFNEVIGKLIHKHLIARVHRASGNNVAAAISPPGGNFEIMTECLRCCVNKKILVLADQSREGKKEEKFSLLDLKDLIVLPRDNIHIVAA